MYLNASFFLDDSSSIIEPDGLKDKLKIKVKVNLVFENNFQFFIVIYSFTFFDLISRRSTGGQNGLGYIQQVIQNQFPSRPCKSCMGPVLLMCSCYDAPLSTFIQKPIKM